jgi:hypothetical protein
MSKLWRFVFAQPLRTGLFDLAEKRLVSTLPTLIHGEGNRNIKISPTPPGGSLNRTPEFYISQASLIC